MATYAHTAPGRTATEWEPLPDHLLAVAETAAAFGWAEVARVAGQLHDIRKVSDAVHAYLHGRGPSVDHSTAGARVTAETYPGGLGRMIATIIASHYADLGDGLELEQRLDAALTVIPSYAGWQAQTGRLLAAALRQSHASAWRCLSFSLGRLPVPCRR